MARYKRTTGTLGHRYNNKYMQLKHTIKRNNITTLVKRWPNVVDDSVGPTLAGRWPNGDTSPLGQRKGSWPKQRWANGWCQRWPNQCASVGPTKHCYLGEVWGIAIWNTTLDIGVFWQWAIIDGVVVEPYFKGTQPVKRIKRAVHFIITLFWIYWTINRRQINSIWRYL